MKTSSKPKQPVSDRPLYTLIVKSDTTLLRFLNERLTDLSKSKIKNFLTKGSVRINGQFSSQYDFPLRPGMKVEVMRKTDNPLARNRFVRIVYEDRWLMVIEKSVGILSMQSDHHGFCVKTLLDQYLHKTHQKATAHLVHRLDRETSGLMVFAKSVDIQQEMEHHWRELILDRRYVAVVNGKMEKQQGTITSWLTEDKFFFIKSSPTDNGGKIAITHYNTLIARDDYSLVELKLETGRKNQIRVHMQDLGHPVVGDRKYGLEDNDPIGRLGLHAFRLDFIHPVTREEMHFETPFPKSFLQLCNA
jgi:23S rRNA pseudouridine1911/1915/1917 synthase